LHISKNLNQKNKEYLPGTSFILSSNRSAGLIVIVCLRLAHRVWRNSSGVFGQTPLKGVEKDPMIPRENTQNIKLRGKKMKGTNKKPYQKEKKTTKSQIATKTTTKNKHKNNKQETSLN